MRAREAMAAAEAAAYETPEAVVTRLHFEGIIQPQQYVDRMGENQIKLATIKLKARGGGSTLR